MIFNCENCGKCISSKVNSCPYCASNIAGFSMLIEKKLQKGDFNFKESGREKLHGTLANLMAGRA